MLKEFAHCVVYSVFDMAQGARLSEAHVFFVYDTIEMVLAISVVTFAVSVIRPCFPPERTKNILSHKREFIGTILAVFLGIVTPIR